MKTGIREIALAAMLGVMGPAYGEEISLKQKVEMVVKYLQRQPLNELWGTHHDFITKNAFTEFTYGNHELKTMITYKEQNETMTITFVDEEENGYGNVDMVRADGEWIIPTKKQQEKVIKVYTRTINDYLESRENNAERLDAVLKKVAK